MRIGPNIRKRADGRYEARYEKARDAAGRIIYGCCYGKTYEEAAAKRAALLGEPAAPNGQAVPARAMNLLILGAGDHGGAVYETAQSLHLFDRICFLDDIKTGEGILGPCTGYRAFLQEFPAAIPGFGNNELRKKWFLLLRQAGFLLPHLVHPTALISPSATLGQGTVVEARATVNSGVVIGEGCIVSTSTTVDVSAHLGDFTYTSPGITIARRAEIAPMSSIKL